MKSVIIEATREGLDQLAASGSLTALYNALGKPAPEQPSPGKFSEIDRDKFKALADSNALPGGFSAAFAQADKSLREHDDKRSWFQKYFVESLAICGSANSCANHRPVLMEVSAPVQTFPGVTLTVARYNV
jgi:hypothetical protein